MLGPLFRDRAAPSRSAGADGQHRLVGKWYRTTPVENFLDFGNQRSSSPPDDLHHFRLERTEHLVEFGGMCPSTPFPGHLSDHSSSTEWGHSRSLLIPTPPGLASTRRPSLCSTEAGLPAAGTNCTPAPRDKDTQFSPMTRKSWVSRRGNGDDTTQPTRVRAWHQSYR